MDKQIKICAQNGKLSLLLSFYILSIPHWAHTFLITEGVARIIDIRLQSVDDVFHKRGAIDVRLENSSTWSRVCQGYGRGKWGEKEAVVACKQLNFTGGWRYIVRQQIVRSSVSDQLHINGVTCKGRKLVIVLGIFWNTGPY